jgi:hypothetical protein
MRDDVLLTEMPVLDDRGVGVAGEPVGQPVLDRSPDGVALATQGQSVLMITKQRPELVLGLGLCAA